MKSRLKKIAGYEIVRNSSVLLGGNVLGQAVAFVAYPILTRIYSEADFGVFALFSSLTGSLSIAATGRYEDAFVVTKDKNEASVMLRLTSIILFVFSAAIFVILLFFRDLCFDLLKMESLNPYWLMIPVFIFASGMFSIFTNLSNREKYFKTMANANFLFNLLSSLCKIGASFIKKSAVGLISGQVVGQILACFSFWKLRDYIKNALSVNNIQTREVAKKYIEYPCYNMPRTFINSVSSNLPFLVLPGIFGDAKTGLYFMAFNLVFRPVNLASNSVYQVIFEKTSSLKRQNLKISPVINEIRNKTLYFILPCFVAAFFAAPVVFKYFLGVNWEESGVYCRYILPWIFIVLLTSPMSFIPLLFNRQKTAMYIEIAYFAARCAALLAGIWLSDFKLTIILFASAGFIFMLITYVWYMSMVKKYEKNAV